MGLTRDEWNKIKEKDHAFPEWNKHGRFGADPTCKSLAKGTLSAPKDPSPPPEEYKPDALLIEWPRKKAEEKKSEDDA